MSEQEPVEQVPDGDLFTFSVTISRLEMLHARNFERLVDHQLARMKEKIMRQYREIGPPPASFPREEEPGAEP